VDDPERLRLVVEVLARAAETAPVVFPVHPRTRARLEEIGALDRLPESGITAVEPLGYLDMTRLVRAARAVITDSGGLQKEAFLVSVPCLTMREESEWVETVVGGWNRLIGLRPEAVPSALAELPAPGDPSPAAEIYGAGQAGERVAAAVADWLD
jgi:UDP-N-acetylglucosamine 2-epimerase